MKKFNLIIIAAILFTACDYNGKNFPGYENRPTDLKTLDYTLTDADYKTIADNKGNQSMADEEGVLTELKALTTSKAFSSSLSAQKYVPALLASLFPTADPKSAVRVTYNYRNGTSGFYKLNTGDYTDIWNGVSTVGAITPSKPLATALSDVMEKRFPAAKEGDVKIVEYEYSQTDPGQEETEIFMINENFESFTSGSGFAYMSTQPDAKGWIGVSETAALEPDVRAFGGNLYVQFSAHRSSGVTAGDEQKMWLISPIVNVPAKTTYLNFEMSGGYFNSSTIFKVYLLDGNNPTTANKTELTGWRIPVASDIVSGAYTPFISSGDITLSAGMKYVGFYYYGISGSGNSTTYQLDNVKISYKDISDVVGEKETRFAYIKYSGGNWMLDNSKSFYQLTNDDYTEMGKTTLSAVDAPNYLPILLKLKYPYAQQGDIKLVVYKTSATTNNADEYVYKNSVWSPISFVEARTEQFIKVNGGKWVFDPTVRHTMVRADYQLMCDYVLNHPVLYVYQRGTYTNEEWYYGFNAYYNNVSLRPSGSVTSSRDVPCSVANDTELHSLSTDEEKLELLWKRLTEEGMIIYLQLKYPNAAAEVSGITVEYHITAKVYYGPTSNDTKMYEFQYKTLTSGTSTSPPTFEFLDAVELK